MKVLPKNQKEIITRSSFFSNIGHETAMPAYGAVISWEIYLVEHRANDIMGNKVGKVSLK